MESYYKNRIATLSIEYKKNRKLFTYVYIARLVLFLLFIAFICVFYSERSNLFLVLSILSFVGFIISVKIDSKLIKKSRYLENLISVNNDEVRSLNYDYSNKDAGEGYMKINSQLALDFDIFGKASLFQYLNRTSTKLGENKFAIGLCNSQLNSDIIIEKQNAIKELSTKIDFVQDFQVYGKYFNEDDYDQQLLEQWLEEPCVNMKKMLFFCILSLTLIFVWVILFSIGIISLETILIPVAVNLLIVKYNIKVILKSHGNLDRASKIIKKYTSIISLIEKEDFKSDYLIKAKANLIDDKETASRSINKLLELLSYFDAIYNVYLAVVLNSLFAFNVQIYYQLTRWKKSNKQFMNKWFDAISEIDCLISYSIFAHNNRDSVKYPTISDKTFCFEAVEIGHPLIPIYNRVNNNFNIQRSPAIIIITGANMAGKSTFLRTFTVNTIMAMNGSAVCAKEFNFTPCDIVSSIKIQDSLSKNESYFYAEISTLKGIVSHVQHHDKTLVVLDEILRGTNTKDKQMGSIGLLEKLINDKAIVVIATHDLIIGELENKYPDIAKNYCFEVELVNDKLIFDYKIKNGVSQKLNASFLLKKMGLID